jgi:GT2 family glycosyltransferase
MHKGKISIVLIHYNTPQFLRTCLDGIFRQTYENIEVFFIDNNSPDKEGLEYVKKEYGHQEKLTVVDNADNLGYAKAANQGIKMSDGEYVVITNPDIIYTPEYFEKIIARIEKDPKISAITGKVIKYDFEKKEKTNLIDTVGLFAYKNRRIIDRGQGMEDKGQYDKEEEVFGVSGACPLYRRVALEDVKVMGEYFDEDFFMYKEDVDLSWRFLLYGWKNFYYPQALAYHGRGTGVIKRFTTGQILKNRGKLSKFQKKYSFKNQLLMEKKNDLQWLPRLTKKILTFFYVTLREPYLWGSYLEHLKQLPRILEKRKIIMKNRRISDEDMGKWFT